MKNKNTYILFQLLVKYFHPSTVLDIGSLDAAQSLRFKLLSPSSKVIAFEANPENFRKITENDKVKQSGVEVLNLAVTNKNGTCRFHVAEEVVDNPRLRSGISSIHERNYDNFDSTEVEIEGVRLDKFLAGKSFSDVALWIDVEGAAYEVIEGIGDFNSRVAFVHVEVEEIEIWRGQKLKSDVLEIAHRYNWDYYAKDSDNKQHNILMLRRDFIEGNRLKWYLILLTYYISSILFRFLGTITKKIIRIYTHQN